MQVTSLNPPGFTELIAGFDEVSKRDRRSFTFTPDWHKVNIYLDFVGDEADMVKIPMIRDAIAEYLRSDAFVDFIESGYFSVEI